MDVRQLLRHKRAGMVWEQEELEFLVTSICNRTCADEQLGALAMAICIQGMDRQETLALTALMADSGGRLKRRDDGFVRLDKHSTGGVGDKVSLALAPMLAACGAHVPMVSGRGLLHTGGTLDKLEAIPGFRTSLGPEELDNCLERAGAFIVAATANLAPADKRLYAIRDVTETVDSIPLITASILSKKLVEDLDGLVLDIKVGKGAVMPQRERAEALAGSIVDAAGALGLRTSALLTLMDAPLGRTVGNALEVKEILELLAGQGAEDLMSITIALGAELLVSGGLAPDHAEARKRLHAVLGNGYARTRFASMVAAQGGDCRVVERPELLPLAPVVMPVKSPGKGCLAPINALVVGRAAMELGAGRKFQDDAIDPACGFEFCQQTGDLVEKGDTLFHIHARTRLAAEAARDKVLQAVSLTYEGDGGAGLVLKTLRGAVDAG